MKKILVIIICCVVFLTLLFSLSKRTDYDIDYETWFDTKNVFGNGEYQQYSNSDKGLDLFNMKYNCPIIHSVINYVENGNKVYFKGYIYDINNNSRQVFAILELNNNNLLKFYTVDFQFESYMIVYSPQMISDNKLIIVEAWDDFSAEEQEVLSSL